MDLIEFVSQFLHRKLVSRVVSCQNTRLTAGKDRKPKFRFARVALCVIGILSFVDVMWRWRIELELKLKLRASLPDQAEPRGK